MSDLGKILLGGLLGIGLIILLWGAYSTGNFNAMAEIKANCQSIGASIVLDKTFVCAERAKEAK